MSKFVRSFTSTKEESNNATFKNSNINIMVTFKYYFSETKTKFDAYGETFFIKAYKEGKVLKTIEIFKKEEVVFRDTKKKGLVIYNPNLESQSINDFSGFLTEKEVKALVAQVDNKIIFSRTYTN